MDAYREDGTFVVHLDLPGVSADTIDLTVEQNVLTVHAERKPPVGDAAERVVDERSYGVFSRQLFLGETLDSDQLTADYNAGVLTLKIPIAEKAKPRKVEISGGGDRRRSTHERGSGQLAVRVDEKGGDPCQLSPATPYVHSPRAPSRASPSPVQPSARP